MLPKPRFELKFLLQASQKEPILKLLREEMTPDSYGKEGTYRVTSLYYDSPEKLAFWEKIDGIQIRKKVRLRYYGQSPTTPFLEVKHRYYNTVFKERVRLPEELAIRLLEGEESLGNIENDFQEPSQRETVDRIHTYATVERLRPTSSVSYLRQAWVGKIDSRLRITFDHLCQGLSPGFHGNADSQQGLFLFPGTQVLMEVKFDLSLPPWARDSINEVKVLPIRFSKYAESVTLLEERLQHRLSETSAS